MKVLKFGASWCPGCKVMVPRWKEIEKKYPWLETKMIKMDGHSEAMKEYKILELPTFIFLNEEGKEIQRFSGIIDEEILVKAVLSYRDR